MKWSGYIAEMFCTVFFALNGHIWLLVNPSNLDRRSITLNAFFLFANLDHRSITLNKRP